MTDKKIKIKKNKGKQILSFLAYILLGGILGVLLAIFFPDVVLGNIFGNAIALVMGVFVGLFLQILIHEAGHLIFGLLTGYSFVSYRVGSVALIRVQNKFKIKRFHIPGTAGQCLMNPPDYKEGEIPYFWYNSGGVIINLIASMICLVVVAQSNSSPYIQSLWLGFALVGFILAITNGIPQKIEGMPNDGYNIKMIKEDEQSKYAFFVQLRVNALLSEGVRLKDLPLEMVHVKDAEDFSNPLKASRGFLEYYWHLDHLDFERAGEVLALATPYLDQMIPLYRNELNGERLFMELIGDADPTKIDKIYDIDIQTYMSKMNLMPNKKRIFMAYEGIYKKNQEKAKAYYEELKQTASKYPLLGEAEMELMLADWLMKKIESL